MAMATEKESVGESHVRSFEHECARSAVVMEIALFLARRFALVYELEEVVMENALVLFLWSQ